MDDSDIQQAQIQAMLGKVNSSGDDDTSSLSDSSNDINSSENALLQNLGNVVSSNNASQSDSFDDFITSSKPSVSSSQNTRLNKLSSFLKNKSSSQSNSSSSVIKSNLSSEESSSKSSSLNAVELQQQQIKQAQTAQNLDVTPDNQDNQDSVEAQLTNLIHSSQNNSSQSSTINSSGNAQSSKASSGGYASRRNPLSVSLSDSSNAKLINDALNDVNHKYTTTKPHDNHPLLSDEELKQKYADEIISPVNVFGEGKYDTNYSPKAMFNHMYPTKKAKTKYIKQWAKRTSKRGKAEYAKLINHLKALNKKFDAQSAQQNDNNGKNKQQNRQQGMDRK